MSGEAMSGAETLGGFAAKAFRSRSFLTGFVITAIIAAMAIVSFFWTPYDITRLIVSDKLQRPRSLGVIGNDDFTARPVLSGYDAEIINQATYAVSVEPQGGSTTGAPTGPVVFAGKLIETVPPAAPKR